MCDCAKEIFKLQTQLSMEKLKNKIYKQIIESQLHTKLEDGTEELINDIVSKHVQKKPQIVTQIPQEEKKKTLYRPPPKTEISEEPAPEAVQEQIQKHNENVSSEIKSLFGDVNKDIITAEISNNFDNLKDSTKYNNILMHIRNLRNNLLAFLTLNQYIETLEEHVNRFKSIFSDKGFNEKKTVALYPKFLSALDYRLLKIDGFHKLNLEGDDILKFKFSQKLSASHSKIYRVFDKDMFFKYVLNYGLALSSLETILTNFFVNPYGFFNTSYVPFNDDGYSFYTLQKIENGKRYWKMDCRLETLTIELAEVLKNYCISQFRFLYKSCFDTNDYIQDYEKKFSLAEFECVQLLQTIYIAGSFEKLNGLLRSIIQKNCVHQYTSNDKFDLRSEEKDQLETFKSYKLGENDTRDFVFRIFDVMDEETVQKMVINLN
jgi:hypothetical protein